MSPSEAVRLTGGPKELLTKIWVEMPLSCIFEKIFFMGRKLLRQNKFFELIKLSNSCGAPVNPFDSKHRLTFVAIFFNESALVIIAKLSA